MKKTALIIVAMVFLMLVPGICSCTPQPEPVYAGAIAENILQSINTGEYNRYSANFDDAMKNALPVEAFKQNNALIKEKIGDYISREYSTTESQPPYTVVYYKAKFSKESGTVTVKIVFQEVDGKPLVSGLWMNSPALAR